MVALLFFLLSVSNLCLCISVWYLYRLFRQQIECNRLTDRLFALCDKRLSRIEKEWNARVMQDLRNHGYDNDPEWSRHEIPSATFGKPPIDYDDRETN